jgi:hypothetical protein
VFTRAPGESLGTIWRLKDRELPLWGAPWPRVPSWPLRHTCASNCIHSKIPCTTLPSGRRASACSRHLIMRLGRRVLGRLASHTTQFSASEGHAFECGQKMNIQGRKAPQNHFVVTMDSSSDDDAGGPGWPRPHGAPHYSTQAVRVPQHVLGVDSLVQYIFESSDEDSGSFDEEEHLEGVLNLRLRRRTDAWGYPGDVLRCIEGEHAMQ